MAPANQSGEWFHVAAPTVKIGGFTHALIPLRLPWRMDAEMGRGSVRIPRSGCNKPRRLAQCAGGITPSPMDFHAAPDAV